MRSWLLTVCQREADLGPALDSGADFVILDLAGSPGARKWRSTAPRLAVKIGEAIEDDLDAAMRLAPWAIVAACGSGADVQRLGGKLAVREARLGFADGATRIVACVSEAKAVMNLPSFAAASPRLAALAFRADAPWAKAARGLIPLAAAAAGVAAIDGPAVPGAVRQEAESAREQGFSGKIATHADEVAILHAVFSATGGQRP